MNNQAIIVLVSAPADEVEHIVDVLVKEDLAACVNILRTVSSVYKWRGEIVKDEECLLLIKTVQPLYDKLEKRIIELHSYEVPEVICMPIAQGSKAYLDWLYQTTNK
jgi:periplasmic divalent cation tolerance protein